MEYFQILNGEKMCPQRADVCFIRMAVYKI